MPCDQPLFVNSAKLERVPIPCGRCPPCKLRRVNGWVFRLLEEEKRSSSAHFITLTYDTRHVPISANGFMTLQKRDFQLFMKRLRKLTDNTLKYYACGEYGTQNSRPHFHAIVFNVPKTHLYFDAWQLGTLQVGTVTTDSIAYSLKYTDKPPQGKKHARDDRQPEFALMSKGLGNNYITPETIKYHSDDLNNNFLTRTGGRKIAMPRYYRSLLLTQEQRDRQLLIIQRAIETQVEEDVKDFNRTYGESVGITIDYPTYLEQLKYGRQLKFYTTLKQRN